MKHWQSDVVERKPAKAKEPHGCFQMIVIWSIVGLIIAIGIVGILAALGHTL